MDILRIAVTGATGLLGRNLIFEYIKQNRHRLDRLEIIVLGRGEAHCSLHDRISNIITCDGLAFIRSDDVSVDDLFHFIDHHIHCIDIDYSQPDLALSQQDFRLFKSRPIDHFFHIAAMTDFRNDDPVKSRLDAFNILGTARVLSLLELLRINEFCYVGSAYSCGMTSGEIAADYINPDQPFRNHYEKTKLQAEMMTRDFAARQRLKYRCFRPSTLCGRLIEPELGKINKFDVFYGFGAFWLYMKSKLIADPGRLYEEDVRIDASIHYNMESGLNIVPADYAAKLIYRVCSREIAGDSFHLVNRNETPHAFYIERILNTLGIHGIRWVGKLPSRKNRFETLFYKSMGKIFAPYTLSEPMLFDTSNLDRASHASDLPCPDIDENNFSLLMSFAKRHDFGISKR